MQLKTSIFFFLIFFYDLSLHDLQTYKGNQKHLFKAEGNVMAINKNLTHHFYDTKYTRV
jgi:hypothetical protein